MSLSLPLGSPFPKGARATPNFLFCFLASSGVAKGFLGGCLPKGVLWVVWLVEMFVLYQFTVILHHRILQDFHNMGFHQSNHIQHSVFLPHQLSMVLLFLLLIPIPSFVHFLIIGYLSIYMVTYKRAYRISINFVNSCNFRN